MSNTNRITKMVKPWLEAGQTQAREVKLKRNLFLRYLNDGKGERLLAYRKGYEVCSLSEAATVMKSVKAALEALYEGTTWTVKRSGEASGQMVINRQKVTCTGYTITWQMEEAAGVEVGLFE